MIPITDHPSPSVATRAKLILVGGGVTILARCPSGAVASVRGHTEDTYRVRISTLGATCSCVATKLCAHIGAAGLAAGEAPRGDHLDVEGVCAVCGCSTSPLAFESLLERMGRS